LFFLSCTKLSGFFSNHVGHHDAFELELLCWCWQTSSAQASVLEFPPVPLWTPWWHPSWYQESSFSPHLPLSSQWFNLLVEYQFRVHHNSSVFVLICLILCRVSNRSAETIFVASLTLRAAIPFFSPSIDLDCNKVFNDFISLVRLSITWEYDLIQRMG